MKTIATLLLAIFAAATISQAQPLIPPKQLAELILAGDGRVAVSTGVGSPINLVKGGAWPSDTAQIVEIDYLDATNITDAEMPSIGALTKLRYLHLARSPISGASLVHLKDLKELTFLDLFQCPRLNDIGWEHVAGLPALKTLAIAFTQITDTGFAKLAPLTGLTALNIDHTLVTDAGIGVVRNFPNLGFLNLDSVAITDTGFESVATLSKLGTLILGGTKITDRSVPLLAGMKSLGDLNLGNAQISAGAVQYLRNQLPGARVTSDRPDVMPGMIGRMTLQNTDAQVVFTYSPGRVFLQKAVEDFLGASQHTDAANKKWIRIQLSALLYVPANMTVVVWHAGGSSNGGILRLFIDGLELNSVGDDREKNVVKNVTLSQGEHVIRWELTGGFISNCLIAFYESGTIKPLPVFYSEAQRQAAEALPTKQWIDNASSTGMPTRPPEVIPPTPPFMIQQPLDLVADRGQSATFITRVGGTPPFTYQWFFNNASLNGQTNATLQLQNLASDQAGEYFFTVTNPSREIVSSRAARLTVIVPTPPVITQPLQDVKVVWGATASFSVAASGSAPFQYGWLFNGTTLPGETSTTLTLPNVTTNHAGVYSVAVSNRTGGRVTSQARLTVDLPPPPQITQQPSDASVVSGTSAAFSVVASGTPPLLYQWLFGTNALAGETNAALSLRNVSTNQAGGYRVVVTNPSGVAVSSQTARLTVTPPIPPTIFRQPQDVTVNKGGTASFVVEASGSAPLSYQWLKGNNSLSGETSATLTLRNVATNQAGTYRVLVSSPYGSASSSTGILVVNDPFAPPCNDLFANRTLLLGSTATVTNSNANATREASEPNHAGNAGGKSIWWTWTAPRNGNVMVSTSGSSVDTVLGVYTGSSLTSLSLVASNDDDPNGGTSSLVKFQARTGVEYQIVVDTFGGQTGTVKLSLKSESERPSLRMTISGRNAVLSWPTNAMGFSLEATDSLSPPLWNRLATGAVITGESFSLKLPLGSSSQFYRLNGP
jgi:hypothetical protein